MGGYKKAGFKVPHMGDLGGGLYDLIPKPLLLGEKRFKIQICN
jgi:hypothetical protein